MKAGVFAILIASALIGGAFVLTREGGVRNVESLPAGNNVSMVDGKQVIRITAKGGYFPRVTNAKANIPTVIQMDTQGTFDCSSAVVIPSLGYRSYLPPSGETSIDVPPQEAGTSMRGLCSMGMYNFTINFE